LRYSERDLIALMWLRDRIVAGAEPTEAAKQIRAAMLAAHDAPGQPPLAGPAITPGPASRPITRMRDTPSQPISRLGSKPLSELGGPQPLTGARPPTRPVTGAQAGTPWTSMPPARDLRGMAQPLLNAFTQLDVNAAGRILDEAFLSQHHTTESVCTSLLTPVVARINELWVRKDEIQPAGLFGLNVIKGRLYHFFDSLREHRDAPLTFVASGPDEPHEVDALMLALFWRRLGLRVVYFGQGINGMSLVNEARRQNPRVVALTLSTTARLRLVTHVTHEIGKLDAPRPHLCLVGAALARNADLQRKIGGVYLGADAYEATHHVRQILR
jgi:methanogenic corrinoid protein MtbC1